MTIVQSSLFDYMQLDTETRIVVQQRTEEIKVLVRRSAQDIIDIGNKLIDVKARLGHGNFGPWLDAEFGWTAMTAQRFMQVSDKFKNNNLLDLEIGTSALYLLAAPSTPDSARVEAIERAESGEPITHAVAKQIISDHKPAGIPNRYEEFRAREERQDFVAPTVKASYWSPEATTDKDDDNEPTEQAVFKPVTFTGDVDEYDEELDDGDSDDGLPVDWDSYSVQEKRTFTGGAEKERTLHLSAANHAISDTPGYDGDEWYTPSEFIEAARKVMGTIDLDPASCEAAQVKVKAAKYYTKEDNSLPRDREWSGNVWLNPPYSMPLIDQFVDRLLLEYELGNVTQAVIITNNSSDTGWFHKLLYRFPACFTRGRVKFWRPNHEAFGTRQGQTLFYLGNNTDKFCEEFSSFGVVVKRI